MTRWVVRDEVRLDRFVAGKELVHIDDQVLDHRISNQWLNGDAFAQLLHERFAGEAVAAVDSHRV